MESVHQILRSIREGEIHGKRLLNECDVVLYEYSGYGLAGGTVSEEQSYKDITAVYNHVLKAGVTPGEIILFGYSLGGGATIELARTKPVAGVILQSNFRSAVGSQLGICCASCCLCCCDIFKNESKMGEIDSPVLVIHGKDDTIVPIENGKALFEALRPEVRKGTLILILAPTLDTLTLTLNPSLICQMREKVDPIWVEHGTHARQVLREACNETCDDEGESPVAWKRNGDMGGLYDESISEFIHSSTFGSEYLPPALCPPGQHKEESLGTQTNGKIPLRRVSKKNRLPYQRTSPAWEEGAAPFAPENEPSEDEESLPSQQALLDDAGGAQEKEGGEVDRLPGMVPEELVDDGPKTPLLGSPG